MKDKSTVDGIIETAKSINNVLQAKTCVEAYYSQECDRLEKENDKLKEIAQIAFDIHTRSPEHLLEAYGINGVQVEKLLCDKIETVSENK